MITGGPGRSVNGTGERALGCARRARAGPRAGERAQGKEAAGKRETRSRAGRGRGTGPAGLLGRAAGWFGPSAGEEGVGWCGRERRERTGLGSWAAGLDAGLFSWVGLGC